jgi:Tol biopolymer transport system component
MAFSPDGKQIAISRRNNDNSENIYLVDLQNGREEQLTFGESDILGLTWHPKGESLVYASQNADIRGGYVIDVASKKQNPLNIDGFSYPAFSMASGELFYQQHIENYHIASLSLLPDSPSNVQPFMLSDFSHSYPDYSSASNQIVYVSNESGQYELWLSDNKGLNRQQLTKQGQELKYPRWSHDGQKIAFLQRDKDTEGYQVGIVDIHKNQVSLLETSFKYHARPTWGFNDDAIISAVSKDNRTELYRFPLSGGEPSRLTFNRGRYGYMISDTSLIYVSSNGRLWQQNLSSEDEPTRLLRRRHFNTRYYWVLHKNGVYYRQSKNNQYRFMHYDLEEKSFTELSQLSAFQGVKGLSINTLDSSLLFTNAAYPQSDIKILQHPLIQ